LAKRNLNVTSQGAVVRNTTNVGDAVKSILPADPTAVIMVSTYKSCAEFVRQSKKAGYTGLFYHISLVGSAALAEELGKDASGLVISQVVPFPWSGTIPIVREYQAEMKENSGGQLSFSSLEGFIAGKVIVEAL